MLSIRHDLHNLSMMPGVTIPTGPKVPGTALGNESMSIPNGGIPPRFGAAGPNQSFRSVSSTSSVFMDDTKARLGALQLPQQQQQAPRHDQNNAIALYTPVDKFRQTHNTSGRHGHGTASHQNSLDRSIVPPSPARGETKRRSGRGKTSSPNNRDVPAADRSLQTGRSARGVKVSLSKPCPGPLSKPGNGRHQTPPLVWFCP